MSDLTTDGKSYFLNTATIIPKNREYLDGASSTTKSFNQYFFVTTKVQGKEVQAAKWDIASFYREMPALRMQLP